MCLWFGERVRRSRMLVAAVILAVAVGLSITASVVFGRDGSTAKDSAHLGSANVMTAIQSPLATASGVGNE